MHKDDGKNVKKSKKTIGAQANQRAVWLRKPHTYVKPNKKVYDRSRDKKQAEREED